MPDLADTSCPIKRQKMIKTTLENLSAKIRAKRGSEGIRVTAKVIGISSATLSRIERGKLPGLKSFAKICDWLEEDPAAILNTKTKQPPMPKFTKEDYNFLYECISRTKQLAKLRSGADQQR